MENFDGFSGLLLITDNGGRIIFCSPGIEAHLGWRADELLQTGFETLVADAEKPSGNPVSGEPAAFGKAPRQMRVNHKGGTETIVELQTQPLADTDGRVYAHLHILRPTEEANKDREPGATFSVLSDSVWRRGAHRLNNIFASIHSNLDLALARGVSPEAKAFLVQAQESARKGAQVVQNLRQKQEVETEPVAAAETRSADSAPAPPASDNLEGSERLLLAEDEMAIRMLIRAVLSYRGYTVVEAADGREAVSKFEQEGPFDLVILDLHMPRLNGWMALEQMRARNPTLRALALSGLPLDVEEQRTGQDIKCRFDGNLTKPFLNPELLKIVRGLLDRTPQN